MISSLVTHAHSILPKGTTTVILLLLLIDYRHVVMEENIQPLTFASVFHDDAMTRTRKPWRVDSPSSDIFLTEANGVVGLHIAAC